jgi:hypothetical protein
MKVRVKWDNPERTAILMVFEQGWVWDEYAAAQRDCYALIQSVPHVVDIIIDSTISRGIPPNAIAQARNFTRTRPENAGQIIVVGASKFVRTMGQTVVQLLPNAGIQFAFVDTFHEARSLVERRQEVSL